jgi:hypothetical protein
MEQRPGRFSDQIRAGCGLELMEETLFLRKLLGWAMGTANMRRRQNRAQISHPTVGFA